MQDFRSYQWNAKDYAKNSSNQYEWAMELLPKLALKCDEALLDIGCGDGRITELLSSHLPRGEAVGVDSSKEMISLASKTHPHSHYSNLNFLVMDARELTFNEHFDIAFSNAALHWIINQKSVLREVNKALVSKGRVLFQMAGKGNAQDVMAILRDMMREENYKPYFINFEFPFGFYGMDEYRSWLKEEGFEPERVELIPKEMQLKGREGLAGWIRTTWLPFTQRLPEEFRNHFVKEIADRYLAVFPLDERNTVRVKMVRLEVQAIKA